MTFNVEHAQTITVLSFLPNMEFPEPNDALLTTWSGILDWVLRVKRKLNLNSSADYIFAIKNYKQEIKNF
jgi:hypothetical protein